MIKVKLDLLDLIKNQKKLPLDIIYVIIYTIREIIKVHELLYYSENF